MQRLEAERKFFSQFIWENNYQKQAGAELCQAQEKLGLAKLRWSSSIYFQIKINFHFILGDKNPILRGNKLGLSCAKLSAT